MKRVLAHVALAGVLIATVFSGARLQAASDDRDSDNKGLEGSWDITITTTPNPPFATPFRILRTVGSVGVVDAYAFPPITPTTGPLINSSGHGSWKKAKGRNTYTVVVKYFQLNPSNFFNVLDTVGTVRETITLSADGDSYTSHFTTEIALPDGTVIIPNSGDTTATRIK